MDNIRILLVDDRPVFRQGLRRLLETEEGLEVVAEAGTGAEAELLAALGQGVKGYVLKTASVDELVRAIRAVHRGEGFLSPAAAQALMADWRRLRQGKAGSQRLGLSPGEMEVLSLVAQGMSNREIAQHLYLSEKTVRNRLSIIFRKLGVKSRSQAILRFLGRASSPA